MRGDGLKMVPYRVCRNDSNKLPVCVRRIPERRGSCSYPGGSLRSRIAHGKGTVHPRTGHEGPEGVRWGWGGQRHAPAALPPGKIRHPLYRRMG